MLLSIDSYYTIVIIILFKFYAITLILLISS
jgi:hypothetical protein